MTHRIRCDSRLDGLAPHDHSALDEVRACHDARRDQLAGIEFWPCTWLIAVRGEDGFMTDRECRLPARFTDEEGSYACLGGHDHIALERQFREGIEYASDEHELDRLTRQGKVAIPAYSS